MGPVHDNSELPRKGKFIADNIEQYFTKTLVSVKKVWEASIRLNAVFLPAFFTAHVNIAETDHSSKACDQVTY